MTPLEKSNNFIQENLPQLAQEILIWHNTGLLPESAKLRDLADIVEEISPNQSFQLAESLVNKEALMRVVQRIIFEID